MRTFAVNEVSLRIGGVDALREVSLQVEPAETVGLIGPNGAGKTSLINCVTGVYRYQRGSVYLGTEDLSHRPPHVIAGAGIARTFQQANLVFGLTVAENLLLARHSRMSNGLWRDALSCGRFSREERESRAYVDELLGWLNIDSLAEREVDRLSLWEQKQVVVARALASEPSVVLFDEPAAGLSGDEKEHLLEVLARVRDELKIGELVVEHDLSFVTSLCGRVIVLFLGSQLAEGMPREVLARTDVVEAYLGGVAYGGNDPDDPL